MKNGSQMARSGGIGGGANIASDWDRSAEVTGREVFFAMFRVAVFYGLLGVVWAYVNP